MTTERVNRVENFSLRGREKKDSKMMPHKFKSEIGPCPFKTLCTSIKVESLR